MVNKVIFNKYFYVVLCVIFSLFLFVSSSFASSYTAYGSVTQSTTQISNLIDCMHNQTDFNPFRDWVALRTGDVEYCLFYNIKDDGSAIRLRYYGTSSGYNTIWHFDRSNESNFTYNSNNYTIVGNKFDTLASSKAVEFIHTFIFKFTVPFILVLLIFFVFRVKKRSREGVTIR